MLKNKALLLDCAKAFDFDLTDVQVQQLCQYFDAVVEGNKDFNLTAIVEENDFIIKHFADSFAGISEFPQNARICDIGAGAGFPTVPIAIIRPDVIITALDSTAKKMQFVDSTAKAIGLKNVSTVSGRAEEQNSLFGTFDAACARAVSALPILLELALPMLKVGGVFVAYKTDGSELDSVDNALKTLNARLKNVKTLNLPNGDKRAILVFEKTGKTPPQYPRQYGAIKKKPL